MSNPLADERIAFNAGVLTAFFGAGGACLAANLVDEEGNNAVTVLPIKTAAGYSCSFDLSRLMPGEYAIALNVGGAPVAFGRQIAHHAMLAGRVMSRTPAATFAKIAGTRFSNGDGTIFAWVYARVGSGLRLRISGADDIDSFLAGQAASGSARQSASRVEDSIRFSVITAVYNARNYLDDYFRTIIGQSLDFRSHIELILVDDGSTDHSAKVIKRWQRKYPKNIRYFRQENAGPGSARNLGLPHASHPWITFIDSDDFVDRTYFEEVRRAIRKQGEDRVAMVSCNLIFHFDSSESISDSHPLRFRFANGEKTAPADDLGRFIQTGVNHAFVNRALIRQSGLTFDPRIRPGFEDAHFINRYLLAAGKRIAIFLPQAKYFYRKRSLGNSLIDGSSTNPDWYGAQLRYGCLALLRASRCKQVQTTVLYDLFWKFVQIVDNPQGVAFLGDERRREFVGLLREIFELIDIDTVTTYDLTDFPVFFRVGILNLFKNADPPNQIALITNFDAAKDLVRLVCWSRDADTEVRFRADGADILPAYAKRRRHDFVGADFCWEHIGWLPRNHAGRLTVAIGGQRAGISLGRGTPQADISADDVMLAFAKPRLDDAAMPAEAVQIRTTARRTTTYRDAWLFIDRDDEADDNAEHLYRYVAENHPEVNAFFVLKSGARDWPRLAADGVRLLALGTPEHAVALLQAKYLISSQADPHVVRPLDPRYFDDMLSYKFVFVEHGIIKDDISAYVNGRAIDCFVTSTRPEYDFVGGDGPFVVCRKETVLTGLPRHDELLRSPPGDDKIILIMPTWRSSLELRSRNGKRDAATMANSEFLRRWKSLLHSGRLTRMRKEFGYRLVFVPHNKLEADLELFNLPSEFEVRKFGGEPISELFRNLSLFVTDFSSKAFDVALAGKPLIHYQFDPEVFFGGGHWSRPGYFDYERDGFGPVCREEDEVLDAIEAFAAGIPADPVYRKRADDTFIFRDGRCCERVFNAILDLERPLDASVSPQDLPLVL